MAVGGHGPWSAADKSVMVVGTTNYVRGIDTALRWCGRFDLRVPVLPPTQQDREAIFSYYLRRYGAGSVPGGEVIEPQALAAKTPLFTPADIKAVVDLTKTRRRLQEPGAPRKPGGAAQLMRARGLQTAG